MIHPAVQAALERLGAALRENAHKHLGQQADKLDDNVLALLYVGQTTVQGASNMDPAGAVKLIDTQAQIVKLKGP